MKKLSTLLGGLAVWGTLLAQPVTIGTTTYDLQTNGANKSRLLVYDDGDVSALWTGSTSLAATFSDRGMFFNTRNAGTWGAFPTARIEGVRTGFGDIVRVGSYEVMLSHDGTNIRVYRNTTLGGTSWTETAGSVDITGLWPNAYCPEGTNDIYVVNANTGTPTQIYFSRSTDGGENWEVLEYVLPFLTPDEGFGAISGESYQIAVYGSDVYVLYGSVYTDLVLLHSYANGDPGTWESEIIWDNPLENYTGAVGEDTDFDGDGNVDTILTTDGNYEMLMTDDGTLHVFSGAYLMLDDDPTTAGWSYFPTVGGILYWKTGLVGMYYLDLVIDWNNADGLDDPYAGIGSQFAAYGAESFTTLPTATWDEATGRIYLTFVMPVEYTDQNGDPTLPNSESKCDLFGSYSEDGGESWTLPVNLTYNAFAGKENYFPMAYDRMVDGKVHVIWQQDNNPGTAVDPAPYTDPIHTNYIMYAAWDPARFDPYAPTVDFTYTLTPAGPSFNAVFNNLSVDAESYFWDFGDGATSTLEDPTHTYSEGVYNVCLTGYNVYGESTTCQEIIAVTPPTALFNFSGDPTVTFTDLSLNEPDTWFWDFDDGATSTETDPVHTFLFNGIYNVCLTVSNAGGSNTFCQNVVISSYAAPLANFTFTGDPTVTFTDLTSGDPTEWDWDFGDGATSTDQNPVHTYVTNGVYNVCLTATNALGSSTTCQDVVIATYVPPTVLFTYAGDPTVTFTDLSTEDPTSWSWDFGDGSFSTEQNPVHTFTADGTYNVCLTATNDIGSNTGCEAVVIGSYPAPEALFSYTGDPDVAFTDLSVNTTLWFWNFDDGSFSSEANPVHTFTSNGTYNVCLEASGPGGVDVYCEDVEVSNVVFVPVTDFDFFLGAGGAVSFVDVSTNSPTAWAWDFGDGATSTEQDPIHTYTTAGDYNVCLTASNAAGSDTECKIIGVTAIQDMHATTLQAYPNPASTVVSVTLPEPSAIVQIRIVNTLGQTVWQSANTPVIGSTLTLDVEHLAAGTYTVYMDTEDNRYVARLIVE